MKVINSLQNKQNIFRTIDLTVDLMEYGQDERVKSRLMGNIFRIDEKY